MHCASCISLLWGCPGSTCRQLGSGTADNSLRMKQISLSVAATITRRDKWRAAVVQKSGQLRERAAEQAARQAAQRRSCTAQRWSTCAFSLAFKPPLPPKLHARPRLPPSLGRRQQRNHGRLQHARVQLKTKQRIGSVHAGWGAKHSGGGGKAAAAMRARHDTRTPIYVRRRTACKTEN